MTDSLINHFNESRKEVSAVSKNNQQFSMLSKSKYQFEHYLLKETNSIEIDVDAVRSDVNITSNDNEAEKSVIATAHLSQSFNISKETELIDSQGKIAAKPQHMNNLEYKFIQQIYKLDSILEAIQQSKISQNKNIGFNKEIQALARQFIQQEKIETEYFRIVKDKSCYKLYLNIDDISISIDHLKQLLKNIEHQRNIIFNKIYINREIILNRDMRNSPKGQMLSEENVSQSINYTI